MKYVAFLCLYVLQKSRLQCVCVCLDVQQSAAEMERLLSIALKLQ